MGYRYCLVIYLNAKKKTIFRIVNTYSVSYKIGETTSMGWLVLDKQYYFDKLKQFVGEETMKKIIKERQEQFVKKRVKSEKRKKITKIIYDIFH